MMAPPEPEQAQPDEEEVIHLSGAEPEPEPAPEASLPAPQEQRQGTPIVYLQPAKDETKERARRQAALQRIRKYREAFVAVKALPFDENASSDVLEAHLDNIRAAVSTKNMAILVKGAYLAGVKGVEIGTCAMGVRSYGLTQILSQSAEIDGLLKECSCELGIGFVPAHVRLAMATLQAVVVLDSANRKAEALAGFKNEPVQVELKAKYADI